MLGTKSGCFAAKTLFIVILALGLIGCERRSSQISKCVLNLRQIQICKELWAANPTFATEEVFEYFRGDE